MCVFICLFGFWFGHLLANWSHTRWTYIKQHTQRNHWPITVNNNIRVKRTRGCLWWCCCFEWVLPGVDSVYVSIYLVDWHTIHQIRCIMETMEYETARNLTLLFFLERLMERGEPRTLHDLSCQFGSKGFTKEMRQIAGGSQSGEFQFIVYIYLYIGYSFM